MDLCGKIINCICLFVKALINKIVAINLTLFKTKMQYKNQISHYLVMITFKINRYLILHKILMFLQLVIRMDLPNQISTPTILKIVEIIILTLIQFTCHKKIKIYREVVIRMET